ncbi:hypothetical protein [Nostoc sp.]|uniref:hypothetical protein n=1 Tax=Nostoc sp. TaxID=1180 RepID=UPI002FF23D6A
MVWTPLHAKIHRTMRSRHLFERNQRLAVARKGYGNIAHKEVLKQEITAWEKHRN